MPLDDGFVIDGDADQQTDPPARPERAQTARYEEQ